VSRQRHINPHVPTDPFAALELLLRLLRSTDSLPQLVRLWAVNAVAAKLRQPELTLDEAFGLKPGQGKRGWRAAEKKRLIRLIGAAIPPAATEEQRAEAVGAVLRGERSAPASLPESLLDDLRRCGALPGSTRQLLRILGE
jgi:hypothetical protein